MPEYRHDAPVYLMSTFNRSEVSDMLGRLVFVYERECSGLFLFIFFVTPGGNKERFLLPL